MTQASWPNDNNATHALVEAYNLLPYLFQTFEGSHPNQIASIATLNGLNTPSTENCRVLELGCGRGVNIAAMASDLPDSEFVGIDLSERHISDAQKLSTQLELKNATFYHQDISQIGEEHGYFDYILVLGVYSWVPIEVRENILSLCKKYLTPDGVVMINYAANPGSIVSGVMRDIMLYHVHNEVTPDERLKSSQKFLSLLANESQQGNPLVPTYKNMINSQAADPQNFYHENLNVESKAFYFHEFAQDADDHGLQFLAESCAPELPFDFSSALSDELAQVTDTVRQEQYLDFMVNRSSRQSLLCHDTRSLDRSNRHNIVGTLFIASAARTDTKICELDSNQSESFKIDNTAQINTSNPMAKAVMHTLNQRWPLGFRFDDLWISALSLLNTKNQQLYVTSPQEKKSILDMLLHGYQRGIITLRKKEPNCTNKVEQFPQVSHLAKIQIKNHGKYVSTQLHNMIKLTEFGCQLLPKLNGKHTAEALTEKMLAMAIKGNMQVSEHNEPVSDDKRLKQYIDQAVNSCLLEFAKSGILISSSKK